MVVQENIKVNLKTGLQARPAAFFVQEANRFASEIYLEKNERKVNAKSIMGVMSLAIGSGSFVTITADGIDAEEAVKSLRQMIEKEE